MNVLLRLLIAVVASFAIAEGLVFAGNSLFYAERPPVGTTQMGYRGTGMVQVFNIENKARLLDANAIPSAVPYAGEEGAKASTVYKNLKVLGDVSTGEFTRLMVNMTTWVAPNEGCAGCHNVADLADDSLYTKRVARRMLEMVRHINTDRTNHVAKTGVTCYTCHRGQLVPPNVWFNEAGPARYGGFAQIPAGQNHPSDLAAGSSLPSNIFTAYLSGIESSRIQSEAALRGANRISIKEAERTYALMLHMSQALGVNCNYCHNTRAFRDWSQSSPKRVTAYHGIRMVQDLNKNYLEPLASELPKTRLGPAMDGPKVNCATCHNGVFKPLFGISMAKDFPELVGAAAQ